MNIQVITKPYQMLTMVEHLERAKIIGLDTETTGLDPYTDTLLMAQFYDGTTAYVCDFTQLPIEALKHVKGVMENPDILKVGHNLTFEYKQLYHNARIEMVNLHDIMTVDRMLYAGLKMQHTLKAIADRMLGVTLDKSIRESFIGADPSTVTFSSEQYEYAAMDTAILIQLYEMQIVEVEKQELQRIYRLEMNILPPTAMMEYTGVEVNEQMIRDMIEPFEHFVRTADKALQDLFISNGAAESIVFSREGYYAINSSSDEQVGAALARIGIVVKNQQGKISLTSKVVQRYDMLQRKKKYKDWEVDYHDLIEDEEVAEALELYLGLDNPFLRAHTFLKGARKLLSTYIYGILDAINPITGRVHPFFNSYGAEATGRYSSSEPNFQNLPKDERLKALGLGAHSIRKALQAATGRKFIIADYSGIELVILAANSGDEKLMEMILRGDVHTEVTQKVLGYTDITLKNKKQEPHAIWRDGAKTLSYAIAYGTTGRNVAETLNIKLASQGYKIDAVEGDKLIAAWFALFPGVYKYLRSNADKAVLKGYVTDAWGRRRNWDRSTFINKWKRLAAEREGQNAPIQGTSATMTKRAIELIWDELNRKKARIIITVHDEIVVESIDSYVDTASEIVKRCMEQAIRETLPAVADVIGMYEGTSVSPSISERYDK